ncbi:T9SS type A sorting domain-containing protein [Flavivirga amylovorans]|uniref:T9SS type A sorting domain-containing protein n=1 Tax=Flavivirga amylovorans TaxID=870486 RepID=A0ABT8X491_9FLAO|nr:T9SS type A sorting domain-containing protein [Flavivirga amylovorans]MDO5988796.1 T9SS type A sorting domain-containing protein [Flavivirga amylovorans]
MLLAFFFCLKGNAQTELYVATDGLDTNSGTIDNPLASLSFAVEKSRQTGAKTIWIRKGRYYYDETISLTSADNGLKISGYEDEKVIIDGGTLIEAGAFSSVTTDLGGRIKSEVVGKVYSATINDSDLAVLLNNRFMNISVDDVMGRLARFPNEGVALMDKSLNIENIETKGEEGTIESPKGGGFKLDSYFSFNNDAWEAEIQRNGKIDFQGYISADWARENVNKVATVKYNGSFIRGTNGTRFGISNKSSSPGRIHFDNILYELDAPGEWYFDDVDNVLYLYPETVLTLNTEVSAWSGKMLFAMNGVENVVVERMTIQNISDGTRNDSAITLRDNCRGVNINGVVFRYISDPMTAVSIYNGENNKVQSCDFFDIAGGGRLYGGSYNNNSVNKANNSWENCHFTQIYSKDFYGKACGVRGAGNSLRNNLVHNINGQPFTYKGVDHVIEKNEVFNAQIEEGDGAFFYTAHELAGFGNVFKHNFLHHNMQIRGAVIKAGVHSDGGDAGETVIENIFYRTGMGIKQSWAGGGMFQRNIFISCISGIRNTPPSSITLAQQYNFFMDLLESDPLNTNGARNVFGVMLQNIGIPNWETGITRYNWRSRVDPFWENRHPRLANMLNGYFNNKEMGAYGATFSDNFFYASLGDDIVTRSNPDVSNNQQIPMSAFNDLSTLSFSYSGSKPADAPNIPFNEIGLYLDDYRCAIPDKTVYRKGVKDYFENRNLKGEPYTAATYKDYYFNTGRLVLSTVPCTEEIVEPSDTSYTIKVTGETCPDKDNGTIKILAEEPGSYEAVLNEGAVINFSDEWLMEDLAPGSYELCITNTATTLEQCYTFSIKEGSSVTGKMSSRPNKVDVSVTTGTAPFDVYVNGAFSFQTSSRIFSVDGAYGDVVEVKTSVGCEGDMTKTIDGILKVSPNPTKGVFEIVLSMPLDRVTVDIYNVYSQLISSGDYGVSGGKVTLDINESPSGIYFTVLHIGKNKTKALKVIKE